MKTVVDVTNDLTLIQRLEMSDKLELLMSKYGTLSGTNLQQSNTRHYFEGIAEGINIAYKLVNEIDDDYNTTDYLN